MSQENLVEFEDYVAAIGRRRKLIAIIVAGFVAFGMMISLTSTETYTAESRVSVTPIFDPGTGATGEVNIDTERGIAKSSAVATIARRTLRADASPSELLDRVSVDVPEDSTILAFRYSHTDPEIAFRGADAFAEAYLEFRATQADEGTEQARRQLEEEKATNAEELAGLQSQLSGLTPGTPEYADVNTRIQSLNGAQTTLDRQLQQLTSASLDAGTIIDEAEVPTSPSSPGLVLNVAGAALIGLLIALTATFVLERKNLGTRREDTETPIVPEPEPTRTPDAEAVEAPGPAAVPELSPARPVAALPVTSTERTAVRAPAPAPATRPTPARSEAPTPSARPATTSPRTPAPDSTPSPTTSAPRTAAPAPTPAPATTAAERRIRRDATQTLAGLKVELLGNVPRLSNDAGEPAFDVVALGGPSGEALRRLHTTLRPRLDQTGARVVFVTSAIERGVTVGLAGGLAATAALAGQDALLIAADLHQPRLHDRLGLGNDQGLAEVLSGARPINQVLQGWSGIDTLCVVTAGRPGPDPSRLVSADRLAAQLATIREEFQLIVIEGPPIGETPDATVMASVSDAVVLAVDPRHSAENELGGAVSRLRLAKAPLLGAVVVEARTSRAEVPSGSNAASASASVAVPTRG